MTPEKVENLLVKILSADYFNLEKRAERETAIVDTGRFDVTPEEAAYLRGLEDRIVEGYARSFEPTEQPGEG